MPLFARPDGDLVRDLAPIRRMLPFLMRGRNESVVYHEQVIDLAVTLPFIAEWNRTHDAKLTLFHLVLAALARTFHQRPGLNRFVSNGLVYQRRGCALSFAAKKSFDDAAPIVSVKLEMPAGEPLEAMLKRFHGAVGDGRAGRERTVDKEMKLATRVPGFVLRLALAVLGFLDRHNLLPAAMIDPDPMYASAFAANLGSLGIDRAWHHLYEYGTCGVFAVVGVAGKSVEVGADGQPEVRDTLRIRYTFDERVNDGFYCARSLDLVRQAVERPEILVGASVVSA